MERLNQRDPRWANIPLGTSTSTTIGSHGCTITCIAMLSGLTPDEVNRRLLAVSGYAQTNLVIWTKLKEAIPWIEFEKRAYSYNDADNLAVKDAISKYGGCLIQVDFDGKIATPRDDHWVIYIGNQKMIDPWTGAEKATSYYPLVEGYSVIKATPKPITTQPQTPDIGNIDFEGNLENTLKFLFVENKFSEGDIRGAMEDFKRGTVKHLEGVIANLTQEVKDANISDQTANDRVGQLEEIIEQKDSEIAQKETDCKQRLDNQKRDLDKAKNDAVKAATRDLKAELAPYLYYELSGGKLIALGITKALGGNIKPEIPQGGEPTNE
jgi:hypothetical protein